MNWFIKFLNSGFFSSLTGALSAFGIGIYTEKMKCRDQIKHLISCISSNQKALNSVEELFQSTLSCVESNSLLTAYDEYYSKKMVEMKLYPVQETYREISVDIFSKFKGKSKDIFNLCNIQEELYLKQMKQLSEHKKSVELSDEDRDVLKDTAIQILLKISKAKTLYIEVEKVFKKKHYM